MSILNCNLKESNRIVYKSALNAAFFGGILGGCVQSCSLINKYVKNRDIVDFSFKKGLIATAKNAGYCALLSGLLTFGVNSFSVLFSKKNEIQKNSQ